ncbi:hypothetical protein [Mycobacterium tuberculosis]|uniref:hypothetical protein n=1 Tax=Mycobacterium tuberculosis TaxID=1773 RepID=UPI00114D4B37|nr:hypothetical protein [Mycobacterium tuberculosis]
MLQQTLNTTPALVPGERTDALALAEAYGQATAFAMEQDHPAWQSAANDVNAKDARMKAICGGVICHPVGGRRSWWVRGGLRSPMRRWPG